MARRRKRAEHDNHERWLISYADFVTLLFAFFVVMYSISSVNEGKYKTFSDSLNSAFSESSSTVVPNTQGQLFKVLVDKRDARMLEQQRKIQAQMKAVDASLREVMGPLIAQGLVGVHQTKRGVVVDISASTLFREGEEKLQPGAQETLQQVALVLSRENQSVEVEGHTDDVPIKTTQFPSNWELSSGRASSVVRTLVTYGVPEKRLAAVGMAANQPVVANDTPENRAKNRRVSITILSPEFDRLADSAESLPAVEAAKPSDSAKSPAQVKPVVKAAPVVKN
ncbi:MAG TPA: flagellar motor protein MotD [Gallionella sp.]|jgi:chemotaxis protein MotB|nr:flagellar motor protein MotD [Gallionella sp.]OGS68732.1 MAG: flagellar motor protein MotD [Gallionellales bacterium GWA2_54_124]HCI53363.1 flagellar motor protein MotD [Gallionella sp.]